MKTDKVDVCLIATSQVDLGVRALSAFLKENDYSVNIGFFHSLRDKYTKKELKKIINWIAKRDPDVVGISSIQYSRQKTKQLSRIIKQNLDLTVVVGGSDPTLNPEPYLNETDYVVRGEGEKSFLEMIESIVAGEKPDDIKNVCYLKDGQIRENEIRNLISNIDELPFPDWFQYENHYDLKNGDVVQKNSFTIHNYSFSHISKQNMILFTIRGCPFNCSYCINHRLKELNKGGSHLRKRSIEPIIRRMEKAKAREPELIMVHFFDDDFFIRSTDEIMEFSNKWRERVDLPFFAYSTPKSTTEEKLSALVNAGLKILNMGIQTGSNRVNRDVYNRYIKQEEVVEAAKTINKYIGKGPQGLNPPLYDIIINNPYEKREDLLETIELFKKLPKPYLTLIHSLEFFSGTKLYERAVNDGLTGSEDPSARLDCHNILEHFKYRKREELYLNSLIYWMSGKHNNLRYGIVLKQFVDLASSNKIINFFDNNSFFLRLINVLLPTGERKNYLKRILFSE